MLFVLITMQHNANLCVGIIYKLNDCYEQIGYECGNYDAFAFMDKIL